MNGKQPMQSRRVPPVAPHWPVRGQYPLCAVWLLMQLQARAHAAGQPLGEHLQCGL